MKYLQTLNLIDEQNRCMGVKFYLNHTPNQSLSHGLSYLGGRNILKYTNIQMGLDCSNDEWIDYNIRILEKLLLNKQLKENKK